MQQTIESTWISSVEHLDAFTSVNKSNPWWRLLLGVNKIPYDFPQVRIGSKKFPLVYFSEGLLSVYERQLEFKARKSANAGRASFINLNEELAFAIDYSLLKPGRYLYPKPFLKAFNIPWIKISGASVDGTDDLLISVSGLGLNLKQITEVNEALFGVLSDKAKEYGNKLS